MSENNFSTTIAHILLHSWEWVADACYNRGTIEMTVTQNVQSPPSRNNALNLNVRVNIVHPRINDQQCSQPHQYIDNPPPTVAQQPQEQAIQAIEQGCAQFCCARVTEGQPCYYHSDEASTEGMINLVRIVSGAVLNEAQVDEVVDPCSGNVQMEENLRMEGVTLLLFNECMEWQYLCKLEAFRIGMMIRFSREDRGTVVWSYLNSIMKDSGHKGYSNYIDHLMDGIARFHVTRECAQLTERREVLQELAMRVAANSNYSTAYLCAAGRTTPDVEAPEGLYENLPIEMHIGLSTFQDTIFEYTRNARELAEQIRNTAGDTYLSSNLPGMIMFDEDVTANNIMELEAIDFILSRITNEPMYTERMIGTALPEFEEDLTWSDMELAITLLYGRVILNHDGVIYDGNPMGRLLRSNLNNLRNFMNTAFIPAAQEQIYYKVGVLLLLDPRVHQAAQPFFLNTLTYTFRWTNLAALYRANAHTDGNLNNLVSPPDIGLTRNQCAFLFQAMTLYNGCNRPIRVDSLHPTLAFVAYVLIRKGLLEMEEQEVVVNAPGNDLNTSIKTHVGIPQNGRNQLSEIIDQILNVIQPILRNGWAHSFLKELANKGERTFLDDMILPFQQICLSRPLSKLIEEIGQVPEVISNWDDNQKLAERIASRDKTRKEKKIQRPFKHPHLKPSGISFPKSAHTQKRQQDQPKKNIYEIYFAHDETYYVAVIRNEDKEIIDFPGTQERVEFTSANLGQLYGNLREETSNTVFCSIIIPISISAVRLQIVSAEHELFGSTIVVSPLVIESFGKIYPPEDRLLYMCLFAIYSLEDPIGGCCSFLNWTSPENITPFEAHNFHIIQGIIPQHKIHARFCAMLKPLVTYSGIDISKLIENNYEHTKLFVLFGRSNVYNFSLASVFLDLRQVPHWWELFPTKRHFLEWIRMNENEIETLGIFFKRGYRFPNSIIENAFINEHYREELRGIGEDVLQQLLNTRTVNWPRQHERLDRQISLRIRLQGRDTRNVDHPIMNYISAFPGSIYDITNPTAAKFLYCHLITNEIKNIFWESAPYLSRRFGIPFEDLRKDTIAAQSNLLRDINARVILLAIYYCLHKYIYRTDHLPVKLFVEKTNNTLFWDTANLPKILQIGCPFFPPKSRVCENSNAYHLRHSFFVFDIYNMQVDPSILNQMRPCMTVIEDMMIEGDYVDDEEMLKTYNLYNEKINASGFKLQEQRLHFVLLGFLPSINQQVGHVERTSQNHMWRASEYDNHKPKFPTNEELKKRRKQNSDKKRNLRGDGGGQAEGNQCEAEQTEDTQNGGAQGRGNQRGGGQVRGNQRGGGQPRQPSQNQDNQQPGPSSAMRGTSTRGNWRW